ncbi:MAG: 2-polyprenyl-6-methoxyphenol hydroxylase [Bacilli bacterium]|nr:2-polyprenyl-6-methoxyphenol hydroxylase [Bacilli bacterium]
MIGCYEGDSEKRAIVIGAGIGGLCTAIALQAIGWQVDVYEKAIELKGIGAGIVLAANAMKVLEKLGAANQIRLQGAPVRKAEIRTWNGKLLIDMPVEEQAKRYGTDSFIIHRAELQRILYYRLQHGTVH